MAPFTDGESEAQAGRLVQGGRARQKESGTKGLAIHHFVGITQTCEYKSFRRVLSVGALRKSTASGKAFPGESLCELDLEE